MVTDRSNVDDVDEPLENCFVDFHQWRKTWVDVLLSLSITHNYGAGTTDRCLPLERR